MLAPLVVLLSAWIAPSAPRQLPPPRMSQFSMPLAPSISVVHPSRGEYCAQPATANASAATTANSRFMISSPVDIERERMKHALPDRQAVAGRRSDGAKEDGGSAADSYQRLDIAALQYLYGAA